MTARCGQLTLPREITLGDDGDVVTAPVAEMEGLREDTLDHGSITLDMDGEQIIATTPRPWKSK